MLHAPFRSGSVVRLAKPVRSGLVAFKPVPNRAGHPRGFPQPVEDCSADSMCRKRGKLDAGGWVKRPNCFMQPDMSHGGQLVHFNRARHGLGELRGDVSHERGVFEPEAVARPGVALF